jgi:putative hydrolase of the HAD superfamily
MPDHSSSPPEACLRNVIFDFGGVLLRWQPQEIIDRFYRDEELRGRLRDEVFRHPDWLEMDRGTLDENDAVERFAARMGRPATEMRDLLQHVKDSLVPMEGSFEIVSALAAEGVPLYGLSNMSASMFAHLESRHAIWTLFRGIVISGRIKLVKPDPRIFAHIAQTYGLVAEQTAFIDDMTPNVEAAARHGFRAIRFESAAQCRNDLAAWLGAVRTTPTPPG